MFCMQNEARMDDIKHTDRVENKMKSISTFETLVRDECVIREPASILFASTYHLEKTVTPC